VKAMVLAAGLGARLRPLTNDRPKALVEVAGRTMLEIALSRLRTFGIQDVIVNVHYFAGIIVDYLAAKHNFGMNIEVSREEVLLDTGGGLKKAAYFFLAHCRDLDEPFILHNVDVISNIDLQRMVQFHKENRTLASLAVRSRKTTRSLLFDDRLQLCGRGTDGEPELARSSNQMQRLAFCGIHVISPRIFANMTEEGAFSIIDCYLRLARNGEKVLAFRADEYDWRDLGTPARVMQATQELRQKNIP
jgi:NDP-sugar pyrophosphorylase family protein